MRARNTLVARCKLFLRANYIYGRILTARRRWSRTRRFAIRARDGVGFSGTFPTRTRRILGNVTPARRRCRRVPSTLCFTGDARQIGRRTGGRACRYNFQAGLISTPAIITYRYCYYYYRIGGRKRNKTKKINYKNSPTRIPCRWDTLVVGGSGPYGKDEEFNLYLCPKNDSEQTPADRASGTVALPSRVFAFSLFPINLEPSESPCVSAHPRPIQLYSIDSIMRNNNSKNVSKIRVRLERSNIVACQSADSTETGSIMQSRLSSSMVTIYYNVLFPDLTLGSSIESVSGSVQQQ